MFRLKHIEEYIIIPQNHTCVWLADWFLFGQKLFMVQGLVDVVDTACDNPVNIECGVDVD